MFALKKILHGRINVAEPIEMVYGGSTAATFNIGDAVYYNAGVLTKCSGDKTAEFVVAAPATVSATTDKVLLCLVTKEMLFDVASAAVAVGKKYTFATTADGITTTEVTNGFGAYVMRYEDGVATVRLA